MKIVMPERYTLTREDVDLSPLEKLGDMVVVDRASKEELKAALKDAEVLLVNKTEVDEDLIKEAEKLEYVGVTATGYNNVDTAYCKERGITVTNIPGYSSNAVAQQVFGFLLEFYGRTHDFNDFVQQGGWTDSQTVSPLVLPQEELAGKTLGLIGYGQIAKKVAKIAEAFGMSVLAYSRSALKSLEAESNTQTRGYLNRADRNVSFVTLEQLLKHADVISVHCPLNEDSLHMCNAEFFHQMKKGSFFINTARGAIVEEAALKHALESDHLAGAGLDVLEEEPMSADCILKGVKNCIITPHVGWTPKETRARLVNIVAKNLEAYQNGKPQNVVE